jgi:cell division protein FtsI (penicillin-binding protein 3)
VEDIESVREPHDGKDLTLSIDSKIQYIAFTQMKDAVEKFHQGRRRRGAGRAHRRSAGAGQLADLQPERPLQADRRTAAQPRDDRHLRAGLVDEAIPVALALDAKITPHTMFDTGNGSMVIGDRVIHDTHPHYMIDVQTIIQKSSNIGTTKIALGMPAQDLWEMFTKLGFGQQPKWGFPGAVAGRVRPTNRGVRSSRPT